MSLIRPLRADRAGLRTAGELGERLIVEQAPPPSERRPLPGGPTARDVDILAELWRHHYLSTDQIKRAWWPDRHRRGAQRRLAELHAAGFVDRFRPVLRSGRAFWVYRLTADGFQLAQERSDARGPLPTAARFKLWKPAGYSQVKHDLELVDWLLDMRDRLGELILEYLGDQEAAIAAPVGREHRDLSRPQARDGRPVVRLAVSQIDPNGIAPDGELRLRNEKRTAGYVPWLLEFDRTGDPAYQVEKWQRYEALVSAWWQHTRLRDHDRPPVVAFVCSDSRTVQRFLDRADGVLSAGLGAAGQQPQHPGRQQFLFLSRDDADYAWRLDPVPPHLRDGRPAQHRQRHLSAPAETPA